MEPACVSGGEQFVNKVMPSLVILYMVSMLESKITHWL